MILSLRSLANRSRNEPSVGWYSWKPAKRLLVMSVTTSISRPRSMSVCQADASLPSSASARPYFAARSAQIRPAPAERGKEVPHQDAVRRDVLLLAGPANPGREEHV